MKEEQSVLRESNTGSVPETSSTNRFYWALERKRVRSIEQCSARSSAAAPTCIWMSITASHCISSAVHDIGTALDVLQEIHGCILSSFSSPYMSFLCCNVLGRDRSIPRLRAWGLDRQPDLSVVHNDTKVRQMRASIRPSATTVSAGVLWSDQDIISTASQAL